MHSSSILLDVIEWMLIVALIATGILLHRSREMDGANDTQAGDADTRFVVLS
jgi:hypothetical protein